MSKLSPVRVALEELWRAIETRHPDLPGAAITILPHDSDLPKGQWSYSRWSKEDSEVAIVPGLLHDHKAVLATFLHEAVRGLIFARQVQDGVDPFRIFANEVGLEAIKHPTLGWQTGLTHPVLEAYCEETRGLGLRVSQYRVVDDLGPPYIELTCRCQRSLYIKRAVAARGPITCQACGEEFSPESPSPRVLPGEAFQIDSIQAGVDFLRRYTGQEVTLWFPSDDEEELPRPFSCRVSAFWAVQRFWEDGELAYECQLFDLAKKRWAWYPITFVRARGAPGA